MILTVCAPFPYDPIRVSRMWARLLTTSIGIAQTTAEEDEEESDDE